MAKNEKKVSITAFDKIMKEHYQNESVIQWHNVDIRVKKVLTLSEMLGFVDDVVGKCFYDELGFMPEIKDFAIKSNILTRYANFSMPENLEHSYQMVYGTDAVDIVCDAIDTTQLQEIVNAIDEKIRFRCDTNITEIQKRVEKVVETIEALSDNTEKIFSGLNQEDMQALMSSIVSGGFDEQKVVKAYMDQKKAGEQETASNVVPFKKPGVES